MKAQISFKNTHSFILERHTSYGFEYANEKKFYFQRLLAMKLTTFRTVLKVLNAVMP